MNSYRIPKERLPSELYRIEYPNSRTTYSHTHGFEAADTTKVYQENDEDRFKRDIVKQFTWGCRDLLPFISLFSHRQHAENWGLKEPWRGTQPDAPRELWNLHVIDTKAMGEAQLFRLSNLVASLGLQIPEQAEQHIHGAYLCLHKIPAAAIISIRNPKQVKDDRYGRRWSCGQSLAKLEEVRSQHPKDCWDYLDGYSGSESEALQENWNTIFEKNMENGW